MDSASIDVRVKVWLLGEAGAYALESRAVSSTVDLEQLRKAILKFAEGDAAIERQVQMVGLDAPFL